MNKIWAHRGFSAFYPENTMLAFKKAQELGVNGIETDLQLSKDGKIVIIHDESIDRTSDGEGYVKDFTFEELKNFSFNNNMGFKDREACEILSLEELFDWIKDSDLYLNLELKNSLIAYPGLEEKTIQMIQERSMIGRVIISSFNHQSLLKVKKLEKRIPCGLLTNFAIADPGNYCKKLAMEAYHPLYKTINRENIENLKKNGIEINPWTVNEVKDMQKLLAMGVNHLITNRPDLAMQLNRCFF